MGTEKKASIDEIAIIALVEVQQGRTDEFEKIFEETIFETREEEGVVEFKLFKIKNRQNHYALIERYANQEALDKHMAKEETINVLSALERLLTKPPVEIINFGFELFGN